MSMTSVNLQATSDSQMYLCYRLSDLQTHFGHRCIFVIDSDLQTHFCDKLGSSSVKMCAMYHNTDNWQEFREGIWIQGGEFLKSKIWFQSPQGHTKTGEATENLTPGVEQIWCQRWQRKGIVRGTVQVAVRKVPHNILWANLSQTRYRSLWINHNVDVAQSNNHNHVNGLERR